MALSKILDHLGLSGTKSAEDGTCPRCRNLSPRSGGDDTEAEELSIRISIRSHKKIAVQNCPFCTLISNVHERYFATVGDVKTVLITCVAGEPVVVSFDSHSTQFQLWFLLYKPSATDVIPSWVSIGGPAQIDERIGSESSMQFIRDCLAECLGGSGHKNCSQDRARPLPTRLLDVRNGMVRLCETAGQTGEYCALSYRWGLPEYNLRTTRRSLEAMKALIEWCALPQLVKDAATVTRSLGVGYLWVDALCIIQQDGPDWENEAPMMGQYYREARLTIAASSAANVRAPFLVPRAPLNRGLLETFQFVAGDGTRSTIIGRKVPDYGGTSVTGASSLATRAWAFQENVLSTRVVHFTESEIIWECRSQQRYENGARLKCPVGLAFRLAAAEASSQPASSTWKALLYEYSGRQLTQESDRLPAISGIAAHFAKSIGGRYLAGIWERHFVSDLAWRASWNAGPPPTKSAANMPSWSWASIEGLVYQEFQFVEPQGHKSVAARLVAVHCPLRGGNRFGDLAPGSAVQIEGLVFPADLGSSDIRIENSYSVLLDGAENLNSLFGFAPDTMLLPSGTATGAEEQSQQTARRATEEQRTLHLTGPPFPLRAQVLCVYLGGGRYVSMPESRFTWAPNVMDQHFYLVLGHGAGPGHPQSGSAVFSRLGLIRCHSKPPRRAEKRCITLV